MKSYTPKEIVALLLARGFEFVRAKGSHQLYADPRSGKRTIVPMHAKDLKKGTLHAILKQAGIDPNELD